MDQCNVRPLCVQDNKKCRKNYENPDGALIELWISVKGKWWQEQMKVKVFYGALRNARWMLRIRSQRSMREPLVNGRGVGREGGYWLCKWKRNIHLQCVIKLYHSNLVLFFNSTCRAMGCNSNIFPGPETFYERKSTSEAERIKLWMLVYSRRWFQSIHSKKSKQSFCHNTARNVFFWSRLRTTHWLLYP